MGWRQEEERKEKGEVNGATMRNNKTNRTDQKSRMSAGLHTNRHGP